MTHLTPKELYDKLLNEDKILEAKGKIEFTLDDVHIIVRQKDVVGNIMQEWLEGWLKNKGISYALSDSTQMPPDFFLNPADRKHDLLEVKAFNRSASPGFDIADFGMYIEEIIREPYMLDVDYLVFGYDMSDVGVVTIKDVWLKKVWQITRRMSDWPLNMQVSRNVVKKIRPGVWYSKKPKEFVTFRCLEDFLSAVEETVYQNDDTRSKGSQWKNRFLAAYKDFYGHTLSIPHWDEIKDSYLVSKKDYK